MDDNNKIHALAYFNLLKTGSWIEDKIKKALKAFGITHAQLNVLHILNDNYPEPISANTVKDKILVSNPDVTRLIDRLVKKDYVRRQTCTENRRKVDIVITEIGKDLFLSTHEALKDELGNFFSDKITVDEARELRILMHKIRE